MNVDFWNLGGLLLQSAFSFGLAFLAFVGLAPTKLGEKLLGHHLERRLSMLRHDQNEKIEALKVELAKLGDRGIRANEPEFVAIASVWDRFVEAYLSAHTCVISFIQFPDLDRLSPDELSAFLSSTELSEYQSQKVTQSTKKNDSYSMFVILRMLNRASKDIFDARLLLRKNGIFVPDDLFNQFLSAIDVLQRAQIQRQMEFQCRDCFDQKDVQFLLGNGVKIYDNLQSKVRARLLGK